MTRLTELVLRDRLIRNAADRARLNGHKIHETKLVYALFWDWVELDEELVRNGHPGKTLFKSP